MNHNLIILGLSLNLVVSAGMNLWLIRKLDRAQVEMEKLRARPRTTVITQATVSPETERYIKVGKARLEALDKLYAKRREARAAKK